MELLNDSQNRQLSDVHESGIADRMRLAPFKEQQDAAAGGRRFREIRLSDGSVVIASIEVQKHGYNLWGYLRFKSDGKTNRKYIGQITADTRAESLALGWNLVRSSEVVEKSGWNWVEHSSQHRQ